jgi:outer membrane protein
MNMKYTALLLLAAKVSFAGSVSLTLEDSIDMAIKGATTVLEAQNNDRAAGADLLKGYLQFLPSLQGQASFGYQNGNIFYYSTVPVATVSTVNWGPSFELSCTLNIFKGFADFDTLKSAAATKEFTSMTVKRAKQLIALDVAQSFLQTVLDRKLVDIAKGNLQASVARQQLIQEQLNVGIANPADFASQEAQTKANETQLNSAINQEQVDRLLLVQKLRINMRDEYDLVEPHLNENPVINPEYSEEQKLIDIALANRADLRGARKTAEAAKWNLNASYAPFFPQIDFQIDLFDLGRILNVQVVNGVNALPASQTPLASQLGTNFYYNLGINLTWDLFDGWTTPANVAHATAIERNARIDAVDRERQVELDVRQGVSNYKTAAAVLESTRAGLIAQQKAYDLVNGRYENGIANFTDIQVAQANLVAAQSARAQAVVNFELQRRAIETALGR